MLGGLLGEKEALSWSGELVGKRRLGGMSAKARDEEREREEASSGGMYM